MNRHSVRRGSHTQPAQPVSVSIERIVLDGPALNPLQTRHLHASIERELTRLLRDERAALPAGAMSHLRAPSLHGDPHADPVRLGVDIARSLHAALGATE
jgi:hypothetical protein